MLSSPVIVGFCCPIFEFHNTVIPTIIQYYIEPFLGGTLVAAEYRDRGR